MFLQKKTCIVHNVVNILLLIIIILLIGNTENSITDENRDTPAQDTGSFYQYFK